jgi:CubicO group peptidase (beta-lactamase class C family)
MKKTVRIMSNAQKQVQDAIDRLVETGAERGIQVAAYRDGELVVDAVAGVADPATGRLVTSATPFYNFSIVKGAASTIAHILAERGLFGYDTPVVDLWPEFGAHGKQSVTVRHVLNHSAGVPGIPLDTTLEDLCNWDKMCAAIADEELWWEPGTRVGYHAYTFGYIVGEIVRRTTGKPISTILREAVSGPLGVADEIYFGMPKSEHQRLARLEDAPMPAGMVMRRCHRTFPCSKPRRCGPFHRRSSGTVATFSMPTSLPAARRPRAPSRACMRPCSARSTECGWSHRSGCARRRLSQ